jgi:alpha-galactosidase
VLEFVQGPTICLTPPLGWNSWNCWTERVDQGKVLTTAEAMVRTGLINCGWSYVNIDDTWHGVRGGEDNAIPNHCGGSSNAAQGTWNKDIPDGKSHGEFKFDSRDVAQWVAWGMDYLKYDWRPNDEDSIVRMAEALEAGGRDIVYSLSNSAPLPLAPVLVEKVNAYRTTGDIRDGGERRLGGARHKRQKAHTRPLAAKGCRSIRRALRGHGAGPRSCARAGLSVVGG